MRETRLSNCTDQRPLIPWQWIASQEDLEKAATSLGQYAMAGKQRLFGCMACGLEAHTRQ